SEFEQHMHRLALRLTGSGALLNTRSEGVVEKGRWTYGYVMARAATIGAGTAEIQRNTIAENVLGLPSHRGEGRRNPVVAPGRPLTAPEEDEAALREVLADLVSSYVDTEKLLARESTPGDYDIGLWDELVKFGLPGLTAPESLGGGGQSLRLLCAAVEEAAYHLAPVPLVPTAIALEVLVAAGADEQARTVVSGATAAFLAPVVDQGWVTGSGLPVLDGGRLTGRIERVAGAPVADVLVVLATDAVTGDRVLVSVQPADVTVTVQNSVDLTATVGIVTANGAPAAVLASGQTVDDA